MRCGLLIINGRRNVFALALSRHAVTQYIASVTTSRRNNKNAKHYCLAMRRHCFSQERVTIGFKVPSYSARCGLRGCKNRPAPFPDRMSYKATKPGSVCPVSWPKFFECVCCVVNQGCFLSCVIYVFCLLVVLVRMSVRVQVIDWKDSCQK